MIRSIAGVIVGLVVGFAVVMLMDAVSHAVYPPPSGFDFSNPEAVKGLLAKAPVGALLVVSVGWLLAPMAGGFAAAKIAGRSAWVHAGIVGALLFIATIGNLLMIPHPTWLWAPGVLFPPFGTLVAARLARSRRVEQ